MTSATFSYSKPKVIQALRYHFITRREIKVMIILVNLFAILSAALFFFKKITAVAFLISSVLWFTLMIAFWFILPYMIYRRSATFRDQFTVSFNDDEMRLSTERGSKSWPWKAFSSFIESPHFFHLYFDARSFFIIPKEAFADEEVHQARRLLKSKIQRV